MDLAAQLAEVDRLRALDFPAQRVHEGVVAGGPGFHLTDLAVSADFHDADVSEWERTDDEFGARCQALVELLAVRWGDPETLDLCPFLILMEEGVKVPPPLDELCGFVPEVYGWRVGDRWIGLGVGQGDRDLPFQLVLAIGERRAYDRAVREQAVREQAVYDGAEADPYRPGPYEGGAR